MNNEDKKYLAMLEARIKRLENIIYSINASIINSAQESFYCDKCGVCNPHESGYVCSLEDCCQGLNPNDDK